jgi:hypothetical protein
MRKKIAKPAATHGSRTFAFFNANASKNILLSNAGVYIFR